MTTRVTSRARGIIPGVCKCPSCKAMIQFKLPIEASATSSHMGFAWGNVRKEMNDAARRGAQDALFDTRKSYSDEINLNKEFDRISMPIICPNCKHVMEWSNNKSLVSTGRLVLVYLAMLILSSFLSFIPVIVFLVIGIITMVVAIILMAYGSVRCITNRKAMIKWDNDWFPVIATEHGEVPDISHYNIPLVISSSQMKYVIKMVKVGFLRLLPVLICGGLCVIMLLEALRIL